MKMYILCRFLSFDITLISFGNLSFLIKIKFTQIRRGNCILIICHSYKKNKFLKLEISILFKSDVLPFVKYLFVTAFSVLLLFFYICLHSNQLCLTFVAIFAYTVTNQSSALHSVYLWDGTSTTIIQNMKSRFNLT